MIAGKSPPVWRSLLYVPVNRPKFVDGAHSRGADAIILDLEDSVPESEKERARELLPEAARKVRRGGADVLVRINRPLEQTIADLQAAAIPEINGILVTKVQSADHVRLLDEFVSRLEAQRGLQPGHIQFELMIETPEAFFRMPEIARAAERVVAMSIGGEDFSLACGWTPSDETLLHPKQQMIMAASAAGIMPLGYLASVADFGDLEKFRAMVIRSRHFGFQGAACIHPAQVPIVNEAYTPGPDEVAYARRVVSEDAAAQAAGRGSFAIEGKMIDKPVVIRALGLLDRHAAIERRAARAQ